jgi:sortase A
MTVRVSVTPLSEASHDILKFFRGVLAVIAIMYLGCFGYVTTRRMLYQLSATQILDSTSETPDDHSIPKVAPHPSGPQLLGRITVPRLDLSAMVNEGVDDNTLSLAIGHIPGTALPGLAGNVAVAAHRDTFFRPLKDIRENDEIDFLTTRGEYRYRVKSLRIVNPEDVEVLKPSSRPELTMITCYPFDFFGHAPKRFIVQAALFSPIEPSPPPLPR